MVSAVRTVIDSRGHRTSMVGVHGRRKLRQSRLRQSRTPAGAERVHAGRGAHRRPPPPGQRSDQRRRCRIARERTVSVRTRLRRVTSLDCSRALPGSRGRARSPKSTPSTASTQPRSPPPHSSRSSRSPADASARGDSEADQPGRRNRTCMWFSGWRNFSAGADCGGGTTNRPWCCNRDAADPHPARLASD